MKAEAVGMDTDVNADAEEEELMKEDMLLAG